jgi:hypothetical protein
VDARVCNVLRHRAGDITKARTAGSTVQVTKNAASESVQFSSVLPQNFGP